MIKNMNGRILLPLSHKDAVHLKSIMPSDAEIYFDGHFFKANKRNTSVLAWSHILNKWILWLNEKPHGSQIISIEEILTIAEK